MKKWKGRLFWCICLTFVASLAWNVALGQTQTKKKNKARIQLEYFNVVGDSPYLNATVKTKVKRSYQTVEGVPVGFYLLDENGEIEIGQELTNEKGIAKIELGKNFASLEDTIFSHRFLAAIENNRQLKNKKRELEIREAVFKMTLGEDDSVRTVQVFFGAPDSTGHIIPIEGATVRPYVQRLFSLLPLGGDELESTDSEGYFKFEFPNDIPGNEKSELTIITKLEEDDLHGKLMAEKTVTWGVPMITSPASVKRELWSARMNAPIYLQVVVNSMLLGIWGTIIYILIQLRKIKKAKRSAIVELNNQNEN